MTEIYRNYEPPLKYRWKLHTEHENPILINLLTDGLQTFATVGCKGKYEYVIAPASGGPIFTPVLPVFSFETTHGTWAKVNVSSLVVFHNRYPKTQIVINNKYTVLLENRIYDEFK